MLNRRLLGEEEADRELLFEPPQTTNFSSVTARGAGAPHPSRSPLARGTARGPDALCIKPLAGVAPHPESNHPIGPESPN